MAMTWSQLTGSKTTAGSIAQWINNSQITGGAGGVADIILQEAMNWITGSGLKHWRGMPPPLAGTMTTGQGYITLPADFYEADIFYITGIYMQKMTMKTPQEVIANWTYDGNGARLQGTPIMYYVDQSTMQLDTVPDQNYPYALVYYQDIAALSASNQENFLTKYYARLVRCAVMAHAAEWAKDNGQGAYTRDYWVQQAMQEQQNAQADSDRSRRATEFAAVEVGGGAAGYAMTGW